MSALRRCERCQTLNNTLVNGDHCYVCGQQWARDERAVVTDGGAEQLTELEPVTIHDGTGRQTEVRVFECPDCGHVVDEWCDCPTCGWLDEQQWRATLDEEVVTDGGEES